MIRIAIDGPGGAGKSSLAKQVAKKLGIIYVDTGALYRSIGLYVLNKGISPKDKESVISVLSEITLDLKFENGKQIILLCGKDVGDSIRTPEVSMAASDVSAIKEVREFLLDTQRNIADSNSVIMDGRDIGTVIIPYAEVKIFLTAKPEARAKRRYDELMAKGVDTTFEKVLSEMCERDKNDSTREIAPCVKADDAILLDNSDLTAEQTVDEVLKIIKKKTKSLNKKGSALYMTLKFIIGPIYRLFARVHVIGKENIPKSGSGILCSNHIGINDVIILGAAYPKQIKFLSKKEWFSVPLLSTLIKSLGAIKLDRSGKDVGALKEAIKEIRSGAVVAIFPQGHRYPGVDPSTTPVKSGISLIAYHAHADIIPVLIKTKNQKYRLFRRIDVIFGKPIPYSELGFEKGGYDEYREVADKIFKRVCSLADLSALPEPKSLD